MLDLIGYTSDKDLSTYTVLEPSFGEGVYLLEIWNRIEASAKIHNFNATEVMSQNVFGCELDTHKYNTCINNLKSIIPAFDAKGLKNADFLNTRFSQQFDFIIGNPPYVRYENIPKELIIFYKSKFITFHYRCDLYVLFYEQCLRQLSENGQHCFICSNRWLKNEYGRKLRALISSTYNLDYIIDIETLDVFEESVLAYPVITLISKGYQKNATKVSSITNLSDLRLPISISHKKIVSSDNWDNLFFPNEISNLSSIEGEGFKIGIGVATGADKVFISSDLKALVEEELLLPVIAANDMTNNTLSWKGRYLLNPYKINGALIDIEEYPRAKKYLENAKHILDNRHIVKSGRCWYSLIDKVKPLLAKQPKILLPDISSNSYIFVDNGNYYPAHNVYYITGDSELELELLAAILMSEFVKTQIESISNKMNGGFPRWQTQNIKKIRIPKIRNISSELQKKLIDAYHNRDLTSIDTIVAQIIKPYIDESEVIKPQQIPQSLFDFNFSSPIGSSGLGIQ